MGGEAVVSEERTAAVKPAGKGWGGLGLLAPSFVAMAWLVAKASYFWNHNPDLNFGWLVVLLCAYLFYEGWEQRPPIQWRLRWWALGPAVVGLGLMFLVQIYQAALGSNAASTVGLALAVMLVACGNVGMVYGWAGIRRFGMAYAFLLVAMPMPSAIHGPVVGGLQSFVATVDTEILNLMGIPAERVGSLIHLPAGTVGIDEACSGIRSLQSTIMATIFIGYLTLRRVSWQVLLFVCGVGLAVLGNLIRSLYLSLTAYKHGIEAVEGVHDAAGWSILIFTTAGVIFISWLLNRLQQRLDAELAARAGGDEARSETTV
ncbi:MAG: exosortase/archaeosortase family protein [Verrucomicrobia bacterium]|nr:MAG: exosortase/archaeosortase family protein [Verrucomicrobiota bacterium]